MLARTVQAERRPGLAARPAGHEEAQSSSAASQPSHPTPATAVPLWPSLVCSCHPSSSSSNLPRSVLAETPPSARFACQVGSSRAAPALLTPTPKPPTPTTWTASQLQPSHPHHARQRPSSPPQWSADPVPSPFLSSKPTSGTRGRRSGLHGRGLMAGDRSRTGCFTCR